MESFVDGSTLEELVALLEKTAASDAPHDGAVKTLAAFFAAHFPVLCEVIAETVRTSGHRKLHYWCDVAEMSSLANYHYTLE